MSALELKVYEILKNKLGAAEVETVIEYFESKAEEKYTQKKDVFLTKDDKVDIIRSVYVAHIAQFLATIGSTIAIVAFLLKK